MSTLFTFRFLSGLALFSAVTAICIVPACTVSSGDSDGEGGAGGDDGAATGGTTATGGTSSGGSGAAGGSGDSEGGAVTGEGGAPAGGAPAGGADNGGAGGGGGEGGDGGASGKVCMNPVTAEATAKGHDCVDYCTAYLSSCAAYNTSDSTFANQAECLTFCERFDDTQLCCRAYHASAAATDATAHCPDAAGNGVCN